MHYFNVQYQQGISGALLVICKLANPFEGLSCLVQYSDYYITYNIQSTFALIIMMVICH